MLGKRTLNLLAKRGLLSGFKASSNLLARVGRSLSFPLDQSGLVEASCRTLYLFTLYGLNSHLNLKPF